MLTGLGGGLQGMEVVGRGVPAGAGLQRAVAPAGPRFWTFRCDGRSCYE